jgi:aspartyl-tRNA(Asn)/glutamyl-tRNA(Gln) amidotransferase subunit A
MMLEQSLVELSAAVAERRLSALELMQETLARVGATRESLNAVIAVRDEEALLAEARAADARIASGDARPLEGIPFGVKDLEDAAGLITTHGSLLYRDAPAASEDSIQVARLRAAGAIVIGKTNAPEHGHTAITRNLVFGATRSPWSLEHSPGGSSGGSAAAIAGHVLPLSTASDGGGSIRIPASFCGTFGLKTSQGRIPKGPARFFDHEATAVYGPLTKTVSDAALVLDQIAGHHELDPASLPHPGVSYRELTERPLERALRIAVSPDLGYAIVQSDIAAGFADAIKTFEKLGHTLVEIKGGPPEMGAQWAILGAWELSGHIAEDLPGHEADVTRGLLEAMRWAANVTPRWWGEMERRRAAVVRWCAELFSEFDLLLTPTVPFDPPPAKGPLPTETEGRAQISAGVAAFTIPFNLSWHPAASLRMGLSRAGLPMGLQVVGPHHRDDLVLRASRGFERERPWHPQWPTF